MLELTMKSNNFYCPAEPGQPSEIVPRSADHENSGPSKHSQTLPGNNDISIASI